MRLEEIDIGETKESKRNAILANMGRQVILKDEHTPLSHALLLKNNDSETYYVQFGDSRGFLRQNYDDLKTLIVLYPATNNPLPQMPFEKP